MDERFKKMLGFYRVFALSKFFKPKTKTINIHEVIGIIKEDKELSRIICENNITEIDLEKIHDQLTVCGAGQYKNGYLLATQCLINTTTLSLIARHYENGKFKVENLDHYHSLFLLVDKISHHFNPNSIETSGN